LLQSKLTLGRESLILNTVKLLSYNSLTNITSCCTTALQPQLSYFPRPPTWDPSWLNKRSAFLPILLILAAAGAARAQTALPPPPRQDSSRFDTVKVPPFRFPTPVSPYAAMARSLLIPGWGQAVMGRRVTGAMFVFWEGVTITMTYKAAHQMKYDRLAGVDSVLQGRKKQEIQDWTVLLVFNHLFAAAEAYVAAQLWDFPAEVRFRVLPSGDLGLGIQIHR